MTESKAESKPKFFTDDEIQEYWEVIMDDLERIVAKAPKEMDDTDAEALVAEAALRTIQCGALILRDDAREGEMTEEDDSFICYCGELFGAINALYEQMQRYTERFVQHDGRYKKRTPPSRHLKPVN